MLANFSLKNPRGSIFRRIEITILNFRKTQIMAWRPRRENEWMRENETKIYKGTNSTHQWDFKTRSKKIWNRNDVIKLIILYFLWLHFKLLILTEKNFLHDYFAKISNALELVLSVLYHLLLLMLHIALVESPNCIVHMIIASSSKKRFVKKKTVKDKRSFETFPD